MRVKTLLIRTAILLAAMFTTSFAANEGLLDTIVAHPVGLATYWLFMAAVFLFLIFGVARPWLNHLSQSNAPLARMMTAWYRRR